MTQTTRSVARRSLTFADQVPANESSDRSHELEMDATVERVTVRIYPGPELDLRVRPLVRRDGNEYSILDEVGKQYVDGDDDVFRFRVSEPVWEGDEIVIHADNRDGRNAFDYRCTVQVDGFGGVKRVLAFADGATGGVL